MADFGFKSGVLSYGDSKWKPVKKPTSSKLGRSDYDTIHQQILKQRISPNGEPIDFPVRLAMAATAGFFGGILGNPGDMINVRMQNDMKLPAEVRRK